MKGFPDLPPVWLAGFILVAWALSQGLPLMRVTGPVLIWGGGVLALAGLVLIGWAAIEFARAGTTIEPHETPGALIERGPYTLSRNPIYLGMLAILTGFVLWLGALSAVVLPGLFAAVVTLRFIVPEERALHERFGAAAERYFARVRRWV